MDSLEDILVVISGNVNFLLVGCFLLLESLPLMLHAELAVLAFFC